MGQVAVREQVRRRPQGEGQEQRVSGDGGKTGIGRIEPRLAFAPSVTAAGSPIPQTASTKATGITTFGTHRVQGSCGQSAT